MSNVVRLTDAMQTSSRPKALVIDDEPMTSELLGSYLEQNGYRLVDVRLTRPGVEAALAKLTSRDLVVVDIILGPEFDGFDVVRMLVERQFRGRVLFVSGHQKDYLNHLHSLACALQLHVVGALAKPICEPDLQVCVA